MRLHSSKTSSKTLHRKRASLLLENGYPTDFLDPIYDCPDCQDTGYVNGQKCHCFRQAEIALELLQTGHSVIYFSASGLFDTLARYAFDSRAKEALSGFYEDLYNCDLLIIDDLGTEMTNTFVASQLFSCLNERHLRKNATIISTNLSLEELRDRYSDRVFSRITSHYDLCKLTGPDIRMCKKRMQNTSDN